jgi:hypothetical protein
MTHTLQCMFQYFITSHLLTNKNYLVTTNTALRISTCISSVYITAHTTRLGCTQHIITAHHIKQLHNTKKLTVATPTALRAKQVGGAEALDPFDQQFALNLDKQDSLSNYRNLFHIPRCESFFILLPSLFGCHMTLVPTETT